MVHGPIDLANARVLISNDDGIHAPGLKLLEKIVRGVAKETWVVAPETEQSAASHSLTMRRPLYLRQVGERRFTVDGTPTDCVLIAVHQAMKDRPPDLVISGINRGGNLGEDVTYSGTVAAAKEGALLGIRAIAVSQVYEDRNAVFWETSEECVGGLLQRLVATEWSKGIVLNVNIPNFPADSVTGVEITCQGRRKIGGCMVKGVDPRGESYFWIGGEREEDRGRQGTDLEAVYRGAISVTPLSLDMTHQPSVKMLRADFR